MFSARCFLETHFETPDGVLALASKHGYAVPGRQTIKRWFDRDSMPGDWLAVLLAVVEAEEGKPPSLRVLVATSVPS